MEDYKEETKIGQKPANNALKRKRKATVHKDTPVKRNQRPQRQSSQLLTAPMTRQASRPPRAPKFQPILRTTRTTTQAKVSSDVQTADRQSETVSTHAHSKDQGGRRYTDDSVVDMIDHLLHSGDELSDGTADGAKLVIATQRQLHEKAQKSSHDGDESIIGQSLDLDGESSGEITASAEARTATGQRLEDVALILAHDSAVDRSLASDGQLRTSVEVRGRQPSEDDLSLSEYLASEGTRICSKMQRLEAVLRKCDENLRITIDLRESEGSSLVTYRKDARVAKERLETVQQVEQQSAAIGSMAGPAHDTTSQKAQNFLSAASEWREALQAAFGRMMANIEIMETRFNTRHEDISRIEQHKQNATVELQAWKEWQGNGGKIFPH